jgi:anti-sigma regulatory factor (Ser/Thr protein kinase)
VDKELALYVADGPDGAVVALYGPLSVRTVPEISGELGKALVNRGCVLVDLSGLRLDWEPGVAVFGTVLGYAGGWPGAQMVLFGADGELATALARSRVTQAVPLVADLLEAIQRVQGRPERVRRFRDLPPESGAPGAARATVHQACLDWEIPIETENAAALVVSELATNAVVHAETPLRAGVELSGEVLWISVRDLRPDLPLRLFARRRKLVGSPDRVPRDFGLHVVSALARNWGVTEQPDAKTVWGAAPAVKCRDSRGGPAHVVVPDPPRLAIEPLTVNALQ